MMSSNILTKSSKSNITTLLAKHPILPPPVMPGSLPSEPPLVVDVDSVLGSIQSFPKGTSCGRDGLRAQHILDALCGVELLKAISVVVNLLLEGRCPKVLAEFMASAPLMSLLKPYNGIRPITVGAICRRLVSKVAMRGVRKEMSKYLGDFQFGVGVLSRAEAVLYGANRFLNKFHLYGSLAILTVDFSNAFNLVDQTTLLNNVQTRCPSISLWVDFLYGQSARDCCHLLFHAWYLDYGTIIKETKEPSCNGEKVKDGLFPRDIRRPKLGVKLLGGEVSRDAGFISSLAVKRASRAVELMSLLPSLRYPQSEILLLRSCMDVAKLLFGLRMCQPMYIGEVVSIFDNGLRRAIEAIVDHILQGCGIDGADSDYGYALDHVRKVCLDSFGEHAVHYKKLPGFKYRHDLGKHACVDITGVSLLVGVRDNGFVAGQAALKAESSKVAKHEKAYDDLPRPPGLQRLAKSQRTSSNSTASSGSNPAAYQEFMAEQYELDRKAKMTVLERESEDRRRLIQSQRIAEDMRVLQIDTRGMDAADAAIINAQKARIRAAYPPPPN
ncbi:hypothetical protein Tco_0866523 [Tanacetum coccineum]